MNGIEFYEFLREQYKHNGQPLYGNFTFCGWLYKPRTGTYSFRFNIPNNTPKAIPRDILIISWEANQLINDEWLEEHFDMNFHNDCRLNVLNFLLTEYEHLS